MTTSMQSDRERALSKAVSVQRVRSKLAIHFSNESEAQAALVALATAPSPDETVDDVARDARAQIAELTRERDEAIEEAAKAVAAYHNLYETWTESRARHLEAEAERDALRERIKELENDSSQDQRRVRFRV